MSTLKLDLATPPVKSQFYTCDKCGIVAVRHHLEINWCSVHEVWVCRRCWSYKDC